MTARIVMLTFHTITDEIEKPVRLDVRAHDGRSGELLEVLPPKLMAAWLADHGCEPVLGGNGLWQSKRGWL